MRVQNHVCLFLCACVRVDNDIMCAPYPLIAGSAMEQMVCEWLSRKVQIRRNLQDSGADLRESGMCYVLRSSARV